MLGTGIYRSREGRRAVLAAYDALLERWPVPLQRLTVGTDLGQTFALASGPADAPPLVLLHGAGSNSGVWIGEIARLAREHRVFAVDLPGEPGRTCEARPPLRGTALASWLLTALDRLGIERAALLGFSQGGWTALKAATAAPERVSRLLLLSPGGITHDSLWFAVRAGLYQLLGDRGRARIRQMVFGQEPVPGEMDDYVALLMREFKPRMDRLPLFSDQQLRQLTMPTLVLVGSEDELRSPAPIIARVRRLVPNVAAELVPGGSHALMNAFDRVEQYLGETGRPNPVT
jgi:pimeloyl-ACP methyl ester carboxylesterase